MRDPLATLLKVRRLACDDAMRGLVVALEAEDTARVAVRALERAISDEAEIALDPASPDTLVESYGRWLPAARQQLSAAQEILVERETDTARRRAELTACRTALETAETLWTERRANEAKRLERQFQKELDDRPTATDGPH